MNIYDNDQAENLRKAVEKNKSDNESKNNNGEINKNTLDQASHLREIMKNKESKTESYNLYETMAINDAEFLLY